MHPLSTSLRLDVVCRVFALTVALLIMFGVHLLFWWGGMGVQADRGLMNKGLPVLGFLALRDIYCLWKRYKNEQDAG